MIYLSKGGGPVPIQTIRGSAPGQVVGRMLPKFTQLKKNKRFDNFIYMLVWVQGSP